MAHYIMLVNWTDQGVRTAKDTIKRAEGVKEMAKAAGMTVKDIHWTLGTYDLVVTIEANDDMALAAFGLTMAKGGNVRTQTMRAFTQTEMSQILTKVT